MTDQSPIDMISPFRSALSAAGFLGEVETDTALRSAMSTDNSVYQIMPDLIVAPVDAADLVRLAAVLDTPPFLTLPVTARGGGTGTNGQSLNRGVIVDLRRHMNRLMGVNTQEGWADVEPGIVLDDLNDRLRPTGWFFAPETSTSSRCTIGGMVSTDASGKGSRIYGKTSDNIIGIELARAEGLLSSMESPPGWAVAMLARAETAARTGRAAFIAHTPRLNRRFTGYDLERACPPEGGFEWWRLFLGSEGTLGLISRIRVRLRRIEAGKRLIVVGFDSFRNALAAATPLIAADPTAVEVMDERVQAIAESAGILRRLPRTLQSLPGQKIAYVFVEINGDDPALLDLRVNHCRQIVAGLPGAGATHVAADLDEIRDLWAIRSAGVGLLGKVDGPARPVAFVEDCVVPPENLPAFVDEFLAVLTRHDLGFGIYGHVDVGCLHIRPALNIDADADREKLVAVSDAVFALTRKYGGIFWGEHGKGVRGAYLRDWIGAEAYGALQGVKAAFDPAGRFNPGKLVSPRDDIMGISTTPFRPFNAPDGDPLTRAFRCNGNAQCLSYSEKTPMCPSFKATADLRHSPKGRADALRAWHVAKRSGAVSPEMEADLLGVLDGCLGCKACASSCPVQVDIPTMRSAFYADYFARHPRGIADQLTLLAERSSPAIAAFSPLLRPVWPFLARLGGALVGSVDLPGRIAPRPPADLCLSEAELQRGSLPDGTVILVQDWFTALFDPDLLADFVAGFSALGLHPRLLEMLPAGKAAQTMGDMVRFRRMATRLNARLQLAGRTGRPLIGMDPAFVMQLRQDYPKAGIHPPAVQLPQEFLAAEMAAGRIAARPRKSGKVRIMSHCTEATGVANAPALWKEVFAGLGITAEAPATGCCGMAGLFGHQTRHQTVSRKLFDMSWRRHTEDETPLAATGFSCRCQTGRLSGRSPRHPLGLLAQALAG
ncbi:FAD-binding and (Fe-S)-binding domain-containing protein [Paenirhodobacter populi]|uniref:FAD-binding oxidoreductase n=1 Tax=Paenirhodobacter populi TaxID=2306993 RepID=A0A443IRD8_9RHOB|nr:FAD-binding and (Fe-S)-binding domain-containing protein [Sinirhodobacter populi]RWR09602.1 FAD-binding oxidoreductase [Sinirhodobacter populi]